MDNVLERLPQGARIAVIRLRSLGDCVLTTPALSLLKNARPDLEIAVVAEEPFAPIFSGNPNVARVLEPSVSEIANWRPGLTLNFHGGTRSAHLTIASRASLRAGFGHFRLQGIYNVRVPRAQDIMGVHRKVHTAEHLASAMFYLGVPAQEIPRARLFPSTPANGHPYAILHPVASAPDKTWSPENFRQVAEYFQRDLGVEPVFIGGKNDSLSEFAQFRCIAGAPLEEVKSLISGASLFLGNDSGPAHMAAALGLPVVVVFGASDPEIWGPWRPESAALFHDPQIGNIRPARVIEALGNLYRVPAAIS